MDETFQRFLREEVKKSQFAHRDPSNYTRKDVYQHLRKVIERLYVWHMDAANQNSPYSYVIQLAFYNDVIFCLSVLEALEDHGNSKNL